ncbi:MAG: hypothetical protein ACRDL4_17770, partial [Thermoleophilaceae bacterium]
MTEQSRPAATDVRERPAGPAARSVDGLGSMLEARRWRAVALVTPGLVALATGVVLSIFDGGFTPTAWYAAALFLLCLLAVVTALE